MAKKLKDIRKELEERQHEHVDESTIEDVVREHVSFAEYDQSGWNKVYCAVCGDGSKTKGPRGGWKLEGEDCQYNCFNCGISGAFTPHNEIFMSKDMRTIFEAFGIPKREYARILFRVRNNKDYKIKKPEKKKERIDDIVGDGLALPDYLVDLESAANTNIGKKAIHFLESEKHISYKDYPFFITYGKTNSKSQQDKINSRIMVNRLIIPIYYNRKLLLLQGRALDGNPKNKYINIGNVASTLYGLDRLKDEHKYVFVTEGFFDAYHLNGVACITNKLTSQKIKMLNMLDKEKVIVPDRGEEYTTMMNKGIEENWGFSVPKELKSCKDVVNSIDKYGKLYTTYCIMKAAKIGDEAKFFASALGKV